MIKKKTSNYVTDGKSFYRDNDALTKLHADTRVILIYALLYYWQYFLTVYRIQHIVPYCTAKRGIILAEKEKSPEENENQTNNKGTGSSEQTPEKTTPEPKRPAEGKPDLQKKKEKKGKQGPAEGVEAPAKKKEHDENFNYIIRIANTDINGERSVVQGLTQIKGIGRHMAVFIADTAGISRNLKFGNLAEPDIQKLKDALETIDETAPAWMLNHRKDLYTGEDMHLISTDVATRLRDDVNLMKMIRCYKGVRHEVGLKVRGQRTSSNGRKGLALGVSKRREAPASSGKKEEKKEKE
jgi:small subunit ribosomal protein S13